MPIKSNKIVHTADAKDIDAECKVDRPKTPHKPKKCRVVTDSEIDSLVDKMTTLNPGSDTPVEQRLVEVYMCHKCDKTYKSKAGVKRHIEKCVN